MHLQSPLKPHSAHDQTNPIGCLHYARNETGLALGGSRSHRTDAAETSVSSAPAEWRETDLSWVNLTRVRYSQDTNLPVNLTNHRHRARGKSRKKICSTYSPLHGREEIGNGRWSPIEKALMQHDAQTFQTGCFVSSLNALSYQFKIKRFSERP